MDDLSSDVMVSWFERLIRMQVAGGASIAVALCLTVSSPSQAVGAESLPATLKQALALAYKQNLTLQGERANLRAIKENVTQAKGGYKPTISSSLYGGLQSTRDVMRGGPPVNSDLGQAGVSLGVTQPVFDGWKTPNAVGQANEQVFASARTCVWPSKTSRWIRSAPICWCSPHSRWLRRRTRTLLC